MASTLEQQADRQPAPDEIVTVWFSIPCKVVNEMNYGDICLEPVDPAKAACMRAAWGCSGFIAHDRGDGEYEAYNLA
jgi:hypothetical protein